MPDLTAIYLLVTNPNSSVSPSQGQPAANVTGYMIEAREGETEVAQVMARVAGDYGINCQLTGFDAQYAVKRRLTATLQEDEG
jgi:hypothetical protein